jgi:hypothetical protein
MVAHKIIREFRKWSTPEVVDENSMYNISIIWSIQYMTNGKPNPHMNAFKRSALTSVSVQANSDSNFHMSYNGVIGGEPGMPITTTMSLFFQEVDIITRGDHEFVESECYQGF